MPEWGKTLRLIGCYTTAESCNLGGFCVVNRQVRDHEILSAVFAKMDVPAMTIAVGVLGALALFLATAVLLLQPVPENYPWVLICRIWRIIFLAMR